MAKCYLETPPPHRSEQGIHSCAQELGHWHLDCDTNLRKHLKRLLSAPRVLRKPMVHKHRSGAAEDAGQSPYIRFFKRLWSLVGLIISSVEPYTFRSSRWWTGFWFSVTQTTYKSPCFVTLAEVTLQSLQFFTPAWGFFGVAISTTILLYSTGRTLGVSGFIHRLVRLSPPLSPYARRGDLLVVLGLLVGGMCVGPLEESILGPAGVIR